MLMNASELCNDALQFFFDSFARVHCGWPECCQSVKFNSCCPVWLINRLKETRRDLCHCIILGCHPIQRERSARAKNVCTNIRCPHPTGSILESSVAHRMGLICIHIYNIYELTLFIIFCVMLPRCNSKTKTKQLKRTQTCTNTRVYTVNCLQIYLALALSSTEKLSSLNYYALFIRTEAIVSNRCQSHKSGPFFMSSVVFF